MVQVAFCNSGLHICARLCDSTQHASPRTDLTLQWTSGRSHPRAEAGYATEAGSKTSYDLNHKQHVQVPAGKVDSVWDSARVHEADAEGKEQLKRVAEARNGHAWLLLEYMDRGSLQARLHQVQGLGWPCGLEQIRNRVLCVMRPPDRITRDRVPARNLC